MTTKTRAVENEVSADEAPPEDDPTVIDEPVTETKGKSGKPARVTTNAWWCPVDDRSHPHDVTVCDGCGFTRK